MFVDQVRVYARSGNGGNGSHSFRREKFVPRGGPDGGDGGDGGDVVFVVDPRLNTLLDFRYQQHINAEHGEHGAKQKKPANAVKMPLFPYPLAPSLKTVKRVKFWPTY